MGEGEIEDSVSVQKYTKIAKTNWSGKPIAQLVNRKFAKTN